MDEKNEIEEIKKRILALENNFVQPKSLGDVPDDVLYDTARNFVVSEQVASTSYLQRKFKIGYSRAARLIDLLEKNNVVGESTGSEPRRVLVK